MQQRAKNWSKHRTHVNVNILWQAWTNSKCEY